MGYELTGVPVQPVLSVNWSICVIHLVDVLVCLGDRDNSGAVVQEIDRFGVIC